MCKQFTKKLVTLVILIALLATAVPLGFGCAGASPPEAGFTAEPTSGTAPLEVQFTDQSRGEITEWAWDFTNDGTVDSYEQNPSYTYDSLGRYTVCLQVTGPHGSGIETKVSYIEVTMPWSMFRHDRQQTGRSPYTGPESPVLKWSFETGYEIVGSPAIDVDGTIYVGSGDGNLYAINCDGTLRWKFDCSDSIVSSPAIDVYGTIYVGVDKLYALTPDGTLKWTYYTGAEVSSPTIGTNGTVYVSSDYKLLAIDADGNLKWSSRIGGEVGWSSPAIAPDGTIYIGSWDNKLYAINPDGSKKWQFRTGGWINSTPAIGSDGTIYVGSWDNKLYAISPDGKKKWSFDVPEIQGFHLAIARDGTVYLNTHTATIQSAGGIQTYGGTLFAIDPDGTLKWSLTLNGGEHPVIDSNGTIYVSTEDKESLAVNPDGSLKWRFSLPLTVGATINYPAAIGPDSTIYISSFDSSFAHKEDFVCMVHAIGS